MATPPPVPANSKKACPDGLFGPEGDLPFDNQAITEAVNKRWSNRKLSAVMAQIKWQGSIHGVRLTRPTRKEVLQFTRDGLHLKYSTAGLQKGNWEDHCTDEDLHKALVGTGVPLIHMCRQANCPLGGSGFHTTA